MRVLVTGATGFIGQRLIAALRSRQLEVTVLARDVAKAQRLYADSGVHIRGGDLERRESLRAICADIDSIFHLAGYAHAIDEGSPASAERHYRITAQGTCALLEEARAAGVSRFIFVSSIKAMGESTRGIADESVPAQPSTDYGKAKLAAELAVIAAGATMHTCVLRLCMVYGPEPVGNLSRMIKAIERGWFPPLPRTAHCRSMVHVDDVVQALLLAMEHSNAGGQTYLITDGMAYSTREIYDAIRAALNLPPRRWSIPLSLLRTMAALGDQVSRWRKRPFFFDSVSLGKLLGNACYSNDKICRELHFKPVHNLYTALPEIIKRYRNLAESTFQ